MPGVVDSWVGYTGGIADGEYAPTYSTVCAGDGFTEAIKLEFDPSVTSYEEIMTFFYEDPHVKNMFCSDASGGGRSGMEAAQYRTAVFVQDDVQREIALRVSDDVGKEVPVLPLVNWFDAEPYHQHFCDPQAQRNNWKTPPRRAPKPWAVVDIWK